MNLLITSWILLIPNCYANQINYNHQQLDNFTNESGLKVDQQSQPNGFKVVNKRSYSLYGSNNKQIQSERLKLPSMAEPHIVMEVMDEYVVTGNTAVFKCNIPNFIKDYLIISAWIEDQTMVVIQSLSNYVINMQTLGDSRYLMLPTGELYIRQVDSTLNQRSYKCRARHKLTGETYISSTAGKLIVSESHNVISPRISDIRSIVLAVKGDTVILPCVAQGYPVPHYNWLKKESTERYLTTLSPSLMVDERMTRLDGIVFIQNVKIQDSGIYVCQVNNTIGEERAETKLLVRAPLSAKLVPSSESTDVGSSLFLNCSVTGHPIDSIVWEKDHKPIKGDSSELGIHLVAKDLLHIESIKSKHRGIYQCFASNEYESVHASSQINIRDDPPEFKETFKSQTLDPGPSLSLKCVAAGNPLPQITWTLDGFPIPESMRVRFGDFVTKENLVVSYVNISDVRVEDGGEYKCKADNGASSIEHGQRVNIKGPPTVRPMGNITIVAGDLLLINCPVAGYPIESITWTKAGHRLPDNHRQKVHDNGSLEIHQVESSVDEGFYACLARNKQNQQSESSLYISVKVRPTIANFSFPANLREGQRASVICTAASGDYPIHVKWLKDNVPVNHQRGIKVSQLSDYSSILLFESLALEHKGNYTCIATNEAGTATHTAHMIIHVPPRWIIEPVDSSVVQGRSISIDCQAEGYPIPRIRWTKGEGYQQEPPTNFKPINSSPHLLVFENGSLAIHNAQKSDAGYYLCQTNNNIGAGLSKVIKLTVNVAAHFETKFNVVTVTKGEEARLQCKSIGDKPITITWSKDKINFTPRDDPRYELFEEANPEGMVSEILIRDADRRDSALFTCNTFNSFGKDETNIQLLLQEPPDPPQDIKIVDHDGRSATVSWSPPYPGNSPIIDYIIQYKLDKEKWTATKGSWNASASGGVTSYRIEGLHPLTHYQLRMYATNAIGRSEPSSVIHFRTDEEAPGGPPLHIKAIPMSSSSVRVTWKPPKKELTFGPIMGYYVGYKIKETNREETGGSYTYKTLEANDRSVNMEAQITGLTRATKYSITVQAFNSKGSGPASEKILVQTLERDPPSTPNLKVSSKTSNSITITWLPESQNQPDTPTGYIVYTKRSSSDKWDSSEIPGSQTSHTVEGLSCGSSYQFYIVAFDDIGKSDPSNIIYVKTEGLAPVAPDKHSLLTINSSAAVVHSDSWHDGGCPIDKMEIMYKEEKKKEWLTLPFVFPPSKEDKDIIISDLRPATSYELKIIATNEAGSTTVSHTFKTNSLIREKGPFMIGNEASKSAVDSSSYSELNLILPTIISIGATFIVLSFLICILFLKRRNNNMSFYENQGLYEPSKREPGSESLRLTSLDGTLKKSTNGAAASLESSNYPSSYGMTKIESEKDLSDGLIETEVKRACPSPIKQHVQLNQAEPLYATVKRTPRQPRTDVHVYNYPITQATSDSGCASEASWQSMSLAGQPNQGTINTNTLLRFHEVNDEKTLTAIPITAASYATYIERQPILVCQQQRYNNGSYTRGPIPQ
ncbi:Down syndrome cell adhesion molecule-like protein Dscam2 isoform X2 [Tetranychus urticae]|uniref:Down syndrome cell adhesion molecule-like protein Dscam2 isoform X2 n=1 Tax=Tetranychus urticae TaxID=32264 RepID=UPI00077BF6EB|nr:Down syndrome cell adhesion molecule-like protein Dscam2 isoform X2 [Tetranychus urticae]